MFPFMSGGTQTQKTNQLKAPPAPAAPSSLLEEYPKLSGLTPAQYTKLQTLCGPRWIDLLFHLPTRILDRSATPTIANAPLAEIVTIIATVQRRAPLPPRHIKRPMTIEVGDASGTLRVLYFNPGHWLERAYPLNETVILSGKIETDNKGRKMIHPDVWSMPKSEDNATNKISHVARIWPLYPLTAGLGQGWLSRALITALQVAESVPLPEWLPAAFREKHTLPTFTDALKTAHNPQTEADLQPNSPARTRLALDELYATQLALQHARATNRAQGGIAHGHSKILTQKLLAAMPFPLTACQQNAITEIGEDLAAPRPMLRLLQGDVGAGKTLVALLSLLRVIENGHQGVLMAPTEILAQQLFANAQKYLQPLGITIGLLTGSMSAAAKKRIKQHVKEGFVQLLVGTHALTEDSVVFHKLGLAVIDEQHRFGVKQRVALSTNQNLPPDMLIMTATPIPRTLALTAFGDMDVSILATKPPGRTPITTLVMADDKLAQIARRLEGVIAKGEQAYWVCPLVEESEDSDLADATSRHAWLSKVYKDKVALLHGKMKPAEKEAVMAAFKNGDYSILVSTTVIEVGVDVPNATVMVIEHAERFGLSQLHQLRGRVGRGALASHCILIYTSPLTPFAQERLTALRDSEDGFYLAEKDLELRGPGEILGARQSGEMKTRLADLHHHKHLMPFAHELAAGALTRPLNAAQRNALALLLTAFNKQTAAEWLRGG
ncbi:MAG: ATP-dependent DNA helicase RecG [Alphaproteobacteria bacterium]|nr:MAG: ATP-dependent DNA helicase RecG [Alphaproteobacteria bacterium]